jgi:stage II sporulation protein M
LITAIAVAFFAIMLITALVTYAVLLASPGLMKGLQALFESAGTYMAIPPPYTNSLYRLIFLNNIGHFWNPIRLWVWIPFIGAFELGYELLLNAVLIGGVAAFVGMTKGPAYTAAGLLPHGIIEIPAFILEFVGLARWHVSTTRALYAKLSGQAVDRPLLLEGIKDTITLSLLSVALFAVAAYIETFITPNLLGR